MIHGLYAGEHDTQTSDVVQAGRALRVLRQAAAEQLRQAKEERRAILDRAQREAAQEKARVLAEAGTEIDALVAEAVDKLLPPSGKAPLDDFLDRVEKED